MFIRMLKILIENLVWLVMYVAEFFLAIVTLGGIGLDISGKAFGSRVLLLIVMMVCIYTSNITMQAVKRGFKRLKGE